MRFFIQTIRIIVGSLFIISGLVKANDPLGLSYKMLEFFEVWTADLNGSDLFFKGVLNSLIQFFHPFTLALSVVLITLEVVAGVALLVGRHRKAVLWLLLVLSIFFTFLTAYAFWSGKFKNCGCFGDCLPISPLASLLKDVALLILIPILMAGQRFVQPWGNKWIVSLSLLLTLGLQWYVLNYLPLVDCLPFKKGANITQQMQIPAGARPDSFVVVFVYEKGGKQYEFTTNGLPADLSTYKYVDRRDKLIRKGNAEPPIKGFALTGLSGEDSTTAVLSQPACFILFVENFTKDPRSWLDDFKIFVSTAQQKGIPVYVATATQLAHAVSVFEQLDVPVTSLFTLDFTAIRTAARTVPTLYYLEGGTVKNKWSFRQLNSATKTIRR